jgi:hypothetical protein
MCLACPFASIYRDPLHYIEPTLKENQDLTPIGMTSNFTLCCLTYHEQESILTSCLESSNYVCLAWPFILASSSKFILEDKTKKNM